MRALICVLAAVALVACKNEPFIDAPLGVFGLVNHKTKVVNTYTYGNKQLFTFVSTGSDGVVTSSKKFRYLNEALVYIVDSTASRVLKTYFYYPTGKPAVDSTFLVTTTTRTLQSVRHVTYDVDDRPTLVEVETPGASPSVVSAALTWDNGNVVRLVNTQTSSGQTVTTSDLQIGHDSEMGVFSLTGAYLFTMTLDELYWLSKNNPSVFTDTSGNKKYTYWYNKFGYPSNFQDSSGTLYGVTYTQIR